MPEQPYRAQGVEMIVETADVRVAEITLAPHTNVPPHEHTEAEEICYCLEGELTCAGGGEPAGVLRAGQKRRFPAGRHHRLSNDADVPCRFLLVHGVGRFDFVPAKQA